MPSTISIATTPRTLREAIARSGLTDDQIAAKIGCSKRAVYYWRDGKRPRDYYIGLLGKVLGFDLWALLMEAPKNEDSEQETLVTNSIMLATATPPTEWANHTLGNNQQPRHLDQAMKRYLTQQLTCLWDNFHSTTEQANLTTHRIALASHMQTLESLAAWSLPKAEQQWLLCAMCDAAILIGRTARDQLNHQEAIAHHKHALKLAIESTSHNHIAAASMRLAETLWEAGLFFDAVSYGSVGIEQSKKANPRIRGELLGFVAQIYGILGDINQGERLMNDAALLAIGATKLPTAGGINFSETAAASYQMYEALRRGDTYAALEHIERARKLLVTEFPESRNIRWEAHLWINQAKVHQEAQEIEAACSDLVVAAHLAQSIASQGALRKIQSAASELMQRHLHIPIIHKLREELLVLTSSRTLP